MKKIISVVLIALLMLVGCGEDSNTAQADLPEGFMLVTEDEIIGEYVNVIQHLDTGCYYTFAVGSYDSAVSMEQMFVGRNGVSVPYCEFYGDEQ